MIINALIGGIVAATILIVLPPVVNFLLYLRTFIESLITLSQLPLKLALQETEQSESPQSSDDINRICTVYTDVCVVGDSVQVSIESEDSTYITKLYAVLSPDDADAFAEEIKEQSKIARGN